jgi:hypothetical protein
MRARARVEVLLILLGAQRRVQVPKAAVRLVRDEVRNGGGSSPASYTVPEPDF